MSLRILAWGAGGWMLFSFAAACGDDQPPEVDLDTVASTTTTTSAGGSAGAGGAGGAGGCTFVPTGGYGPFSGLCVVEPSDDACVSCARSACCAELEACPSDERCACLLECFLGGCPPIQCLIDCGQNDTVNALSTCASSHCSDECS